MKRGRQLAIIQERHIHPKFPRLQIQLRKGSRFYQAWTTLDGRKPMKSLKTAQLSTALKLAEEWYRVLLRSSVSIGRQHPIEKLTTDPTIAELWSQYSARLRGNQLTYARWRWEAIQHFWRTVQLSDVTPQTFRDFYQWRRRHTKGIKNNTLHKDMVLIRQLLKHATEHELIERLPIIPKIGRIAANPRPWLSRDQWDHLMSVSLQRLVDAKQNPRLEAQRQDLDDFLYCLLESTMRVGELRALTVGQVQIMQRAADDPYALIQVHGKTGHRTVIAGGLFPSIYERRAKGRAPSDRLWPHSQRDAFRELLIAADLRVDEFGNRRNLKSIRATAISLRILSQAPSPDLLLIARNAGTSVAMIDNFYAKRLSAEMGADRLSKPLSY